MNVRRNILIFSLLIFTFILAAAVGYEVSWGKYTVEDLEYFLGEEFGITIKTIFTFMGLIILIPFALKIVNRWSGVGFFSKKSRENRFYFYAGVPVSGKTRLITYTAIEVVLYSIFCYSFYDLTSAAFLPMIVSAAMCLEQILFIVFNYNRFGVGLSNSGAVVLTREMYTIPFTGLVSIEKDFNELFFNYAGKKNIKIPLVYLENKQLNKLVDAISSHNTNLNLFISDNLTKDHE